MTPGGNALTHWSCDTGHIMFFSINCLRHNATMRRRLALNRSWSLSIHLTTNPLAVKLATGCSRHSILQINEPLVSFGRSTW